MLDQRSTSWVDGEYNWMPEVEQAFEVVRGGQLHGFLAWFLHIYRLFTCLRLESEGHLEAEEIRRSSGGFWSRRSWKLHTLSFSFAFGKGWVQKCRINRPKTSQNHLRQHRKTKVSELYLSDCHYADFGDLIYETFLVITRVLPRSTVANYKRCKSSTNVSNSWLHAASNSQGCLPVILHIFLG